MKLLVISDAPIIEADMQKVAYAPYVREMELWMRYASITTYFCPSFYNEDLLTVAFQHKDFEQYSERRLEFNSIFNAAKSAISIPYQFYMLLRLMARADHIHLRAPGNLTLLACLVQIFFPLKAKTAKYAGNWDPEASQPLSYRWQKWILANSFLTRNMSVMAYGEWPNQSANVKPFFTATYSEKEQKTYKKTINQPLQFIFVGTLSQNKNPQLLMELVQQLHYNGIESEAHFYGDGPMREDLEASGLNMQNSQFHFHGNQPASVVKEAYESAHFVFLASQSEGWPKALAEGMWHGCIPIATPVSCVPWMLNHNMVEDKKVNWGKDRGILFHSIDQTASEIKLMITNPVYYEQISQKAQEWSQQYTLEKFEEAIENLLHTSLNN